MFNYIYCKQCKKFYFSWNVDFDDDTKYCSVCYNSNIVELESESFSEMAQIERKYKIDKLIENKINF